MENLQVVRPRMRGAIKQSIYVVMRDPASPFAPQATFAFNAAGINMSYCKKRGARVAITPVTLAAITTAWASGGVKLVDDTNMPGLVRFDLPDAVFADDGVSDEVFFTVKATGWATITVCIPLTDERDIKLNGVTTRTNS